jgi:hypothetical protein
MSSALSMDHSMDHSMDELTDLMSGSRLIVDQRKQFYASWQIAHDNKDNPSQAIIHSISDSFYIYLREINWEDGPQDVRIAKMYIIQFLDCQLSYRERMPYALAAYDVIHKVIN